MSLVRSIDRSDLSGSTVTLTTTSETVVLTGPSLQTPKDTSIVVLLATLQISIGTGTSAVVLRVRQGTTTTGAQIGQSYTQAGMAGPQNWCVSIMVSAQSNFTDYAQWCVTATQTAATGNGTVNAGTALAISF